VTADADFRTGWGVVTYDPGQSSPEQIVQAFNSQSFYRACVVTGEGSATANVGTLVLSVPALTDQAAAQQVAQALEPFQAAILGGSLNSGQVTIEYDPTQVKAAQFVEAINQSTPYQATIESLTGPEAQPAGGSGAADVIYTAIGFAKYLLWGLVGLAMVLLAWRVVRKGLPTGRLQGRPWSLPA